MPHSLRSILVLLAFLAAAAHVQAARRPAVRHVRTAARHISHTKTIHYRRPAVHRRPVRRAPYRATSFARRSAIQKAFRTAHRYSVHRVHRRYVGRSNYFARNHRYYRRSNYYHRGYGRSRRHLSRRISGIVEGVQGNAGNGTLLVKVARPRSSRFRYGTALAGANAGRGAYSIHRFHVNGATRYAVLSVPPKPGTLASLHKGDHVLILKRSNQSNIAQAVEVASRRRR